MRKFAIALVVFVALSLVPVHAGVAKFAFKHAVKPAAHAGVKAAKALGHGAKKSAKFAAKVIW